MRPFYTLTKADVGQPILKAFGRTWLVSDFIGRIFTIDIGKRVYNVGGILQVENNEQRDKRLANNTSTKRGYGQVATAPDVCLDCYSVYPEPHSKTCPNASTEEK